MRLTSFCNSIGLSDMTNNKRKMNKILRQASFSPDFCYEKEKDAKGRVYFDRFKYLGCGFGVSVHGYRVMRTNKEGKQIEKHVVMDWGIFAENTQELDALSIFIDYDEKQVIYCFAEDSNSSNAYEFRVNNQLEVLDNYKKLANNKHVEEFEKSLNQVNVALLMIFATVLLPVAKDDETQIAKDKEDKIQKELIDRARLGDTSAEESLYKIAKEQEIDLRERLSREDLLSVFEGYFLNLAEQSGIFSILAEILYVTEATNEATNEEIYIMDINITGTKTTLYINKNDLVGYPMEGMRIMGIGMLQGMVKFTS